MTTRDPLPPFTRPDDDPAARAPSSSGDLHAPRYALAIVVIVALFIVALAMLAHVAP